MRVETFHFGAGCGCVPPFDNVSVAWGEEHFGDLVTWSVGDCKLFGLAFRVYEIADWCNLQVSMCNDPKSRHMGVLSWVVLRTKRRVFEGTLVWIGVPRIDVLQII